MTSLTYPEAKRRARKLFGSNGDVKEEIVAYPPVTATALAPYRFKVGVTIKGRFVMLGVGPTWEAAFTDAEVREKEKLSPRQQDLARWNDGEVPLPSDEI